MYALGAVPLILQGAAQRENLTAAQQQRVSDMIVARGGSPLTASRVGFSLPPMLLYAALGLAVAGFIKSSGGKNW